MRRITIYIEEDVYNYLKNLPSGLSENLRVAAREYVRKLENSKVSASESKGGDSNG